MITGTANDKFMAEQKAMFAEIEKSEGGNNASLGNNGELLVISFLNRFLPPQFHACTGHYRKISGQLSREIDIMILDSRFPILSETKNGIVYAMQHALLCAVEVKRTLGKSEIATTRRNSLGLKEDKAERLWSNLERRNFWSSPSSFAIAFRSESTLETLARHFFQEPVARCQMFVLQHGYNCGRTSRSAGAIIWVEGLEPDHVGVTCGTKNPLSDFYYMLTEECFLILAERSLPDASMREAIAPYYNWGTTKRSFKSYRFVPAKAGST